MRLVPSRSTQLVFAHYDMLHFTLLANDDYHSSSEIVHKGERKKGVLNLITHKIPLGSSNSSVYSPLTLVEQHNTVR